MNFFFGLVDSWFCVCTASDRKLNSGLFESSHRILSGALFFLNECLYSKNFYFFSNKRKFYIKSNQTNKNFQVKIVFSIWRINQSIDQIRSMFDCYEQYLFSAIIKSSISIMMQMFRWMISTKFLFLLISFDIWLTGLRKKRAWTIMLIKQTNKPKIHCTNLMTLWICWESFFQREIHMDNHL